MTREDKKTTAIVILAIALVVVSFIAFYPEPNPYHKDIIDAIVNELKHSNDSLTNIITEKTKENQSFGHAIDSLQALKPKVITKYIQDEKNIDASNLDGLRHMYDSVFSANHIAR